jgi:hypothetical protein
MCDLLPCIKVYGVICHMASHLSDGVCKHCLERGLVYVHIALSAVDAGVSEKLRHGFHVARRGQHLAGERAAMGVFKGGWFTPTVRTFRVKITIS